MKKQLSDFAKTYWGFCPTDESATVCGEIVITIGHEGQVEIKMATGLKVRKEKISLKGYPVLPDKDIHVITLPNGMKWLFSETNFPGVTGLFIIGNEMRDILRPTILIASNQEYENMVAELESHFWTGAMPRLSRNGEALPNPNK